MGWFTRTERKAGGATIVEEATFDVKGAAQATKGFLSRTWEFVKEHPLNTFAHAGAGTALGLAMGGPAGAIIGAAIGGGTSKLSESLGYSLDDMRRSNDEPDIPTAEVATVVHSNAEANTQIARVLIKEKMIAPQDLKDKSPAEQQAAYREVLLTLSQDPEKLAQVKEGLKDIVVNFGQGKDGVAYAQTDLGTFLESRVQKAAKAQEEDSFHALLFPPGEGKKGAAGRAA